jgi:hypothetical protein
MGEWSAVIELVGLPGSLTAGALAGTFKQLKKML